MEIALDVPLKVTYSVLIGVEHVFDQDGLRAQFALGVSLKLLLQDVAHVHILRRHDDQQQDSGNDHSPELAAGTAGT